MTYENLKTIVLEGFYDKDDLKKKLDVFLKGKHITQEEYDEIYTLINS